VSAVRSFPFLPGRGWGRTRVVTRPGSSCPKEVGDDVNGGRDSRAVVEPGRVPSIMKKTTDPSGFDATNWKKGNSLCKGG